MKHRKEWITKKNKLRILKISSIKCNCYLVTNGQSTILVDTNITLKRKQMLRNLNELGFHQLNAIVLTHTHFDHAGNVAFLRNKFRCAVFVHDAEEEKLAVGCTPLPLGAIFPLSILTRYVNKHHIVLPFQKYEPCKATTIIHDIYNLNAIGLAAYILHTPGHTFGSVSIIVDEEIALVGDTMVHGVGGSIYPPFVDNPKLLLNSWQKLLNTGCRLFLPAHGGENTRIVVSRCFDRYTKKQNDC